MLSEGCMGSHSSNKESNMTVRTSKTSAELAKEFVEVYTMLSESECRAMTTAAKASVALDLVANANGFQRLAPELRMSGSN